MCGICGYLTFDGRKPLGHDVLDRMVASLQHRGPDESGTHFVDNVAFGHTRLSIVDLAGGRQPLFNEDRTISVICNGEIYNYTALRKDLEGRGHKFRTNSDCEVIAHLWEDEDEHCVERLRGMFAFVLYDSRRKIVFGARDRFGQKPLYYHMGRDAFAFGSEIKSLLPMPGLSKELDTAALDQFLFYRFIPVPGTMFRDIRQLPPAHSFTLKDGTLSLQRYWRTVFNPDEQLSDDEHLQRLDTAVNDAVSSHLASDVPVGIFLSGGIDSSLIAALATNASSEQLHSFSIAFPGERQDESQYARLASQHIGTRHHEFAYAPTDLVDSLMSLARIFDQPLADAAALPLAYLSQQSAREVKVVLTGDGGDELFAGYEKYERAASTSRLFNWMHQRGPHFLSARRLAACGPDPLQQRKLRSRIALRQVAIQSCVYSKESWEGWDRHRLYSPDTFEQLDHDLKTLDDRPLDGTGRVPADTLNQMLLADQDGYLPGDLLPKTDYSTMSASLEARAPFLDHQLAEVAGQLPIHLKATASQTKVALRRLSENHLPASLVKRPKRGFGVPLNDWFRGPLKKWLRETLIESSQTVPRYFRRDVVASVIDAHSHGEKNLSGKIHALLSFELWHRHYGDQ